jgi:hypothetical protein
VSFFEYIIDHFHISEKILCLWINGYFQSGIDGLTGRQINDVRVPHKITMAATFVRM